MTTGSALLMYRRILRMIRGVGNGISPIVCCSAFCPAYPAISAICTSKFVFSQDIPMAALRLAIVVQ